MVEMNKPPITLNPFSVQPVGQAFFAGYGAYLAWQILRPPSEAEVEADNKRAALGAVAAEAAAPFLNAAAEAPGAIKTDSGLVYEELQPGEGASPSLDQKVKVHYVGTLSDGTVFDSSRARGEPTEFVLNQVIRGWQEGLALMKPGARAKLTIPADLAYGPIATGSIPANSALCFDVELLEVIEGGGFKLPFM
jgi:FKBP-type peptidyl-prolyl cis-trans isomerase